MAVSLIAPPGVSDLKNFRSREAFDKALYGLLKLVGSIDADVGSIAAGGQGLVTVPVVGARANRGMTVQVGLPSAWSTGLVPYGYVSADDVVTIVLYNSTGAPIDLPSLTYSVRVMP